MKKFKKACLWVVALVLSVVALASCGGTPEPSGVERAAKKVVLTQDKSKNVTADFNVPMLVSGDDGVEYTVSWVSNNSVAVIGDLVENDVTSTAFKLVTIHYATNINADQAVKLTATISNPDNTESVVKEFNFTVPKFVASTIEDYDKADDGTVVTVKGVIVAKEAYSDSYKNTSVYIQDISGKGGYEAYRLVCATQEAYDNDLAIGNTILVTGDKKLYNGLREFGSCSYILVSTDKVTPKDTDITEMIKTDKASITADLQCQLAHFNSLTVVSVGAEDSSGRWNIVVGDADDTNKQFTVRVNTYVTPKDSDAYKAIKELNITAGAVISVKGLVGWYNGAQLHPLAADSIVVDKAGETPEPIPTPTEGFTGVVTDVGFKDDTTKSKVRCFALVQNADGTAKYITAEAAITETDTVDAIHTAWNAKFVTGKMVTVKGTDNDYNGLTQHVVAWATLATDVTLGEAGTIPAFLDITDKVTAGDDLKPLQGVLVKVTGTCVVSGSNYTIQTADGKSILVYFDRAFQTGAASDFLTAGSKYTVSGFLNWYNNPQVTPIADGAVVLVEEGNNNPEPTPTPTPDGVLAKMEVTDGSLGNFTYITNDENYPNPAYNTAKTALNLRYENSGVKSSTFDAVNSCVVVIDVFGINENTKTGTSTDVFTIKGYNAAGEVVDTKTLTSIVVGNENTVTLEGTGIVYVEVIMTGYPASTKTEGKFANCAVKGIEVREVK